MAAPKGSKYPGQPLQVLATEEMRARIERVARKDGVSQASVVRDILESGIARRERKAGITHGNK